MSIQTETEQMMKTGEWVMGPFASWIMGSPCDHECIYGSAIWGVRGSDAQNNLTLRSFSYIPRISHLQQMLKYRAACILV